MPITKVDYEKYSPCRHCGSEDLQERSHPPGWKPRLGQRVYFDAWLECQGCGANYMPRHCKRPVQRTKAPAYSVKGGTATVQLRLQVQPDQRDEFYRAAEHNSLNFSGWARERLLRAAREELP